MSMQTITTTATGSHHGIAEDGRGVLTLRHPDRAPSATIDLPAEVARELDRVLFGVEPTRAASRRRPQ